MSDISKAINPYVLVAFARAALAALVDEFPLSKYLPDVVSTTNRWQANDAGTGAVETATARPLDTPALSISSEPVMTRSGELVPIGAQAFVSEEDVLLIAQLTASGNELLADKAFAKALLVVRSILQRVELARGQALAFGAVRFQENGVNALADFGANPTSAPLQFPVAGTSWNNPAAPALSDLLAWHEAFMESAGEPAGALLVSTAAASALTRNTEVVTATGGTGTFAPIGAVQALFQMHGLPPVVTISKRVRRNGVSTPVLPAERVVFVPATPSGETVWGRTAHGVALVNSGALKIEQMGGIVAVTHVIPEPPSQQVVGAAAVMPVISRPEAVMSAQVLPA